MEYVSSCRAVFLIACDDGWVRMIDAVSHAEIDEYYSYKEDKDIPNQAPEKQSPQVEEDSAMPNLGQETDHSKLENGDESTQVSEALTDKLETSATVPTQIASKIQPMSAPFAVPPHAQGMGAAAKSAPARVVTCVSVSNGDFIYR